MMDMTPVESSNIAAIGYDPETETLAVQFRSGGLYHYADVTPREYADLMAAPSRGAHIQRVIKMLHRVTKQEPQPESPHHGVHNGSPEAHPTRG